MTPTAIIKQAHADGVMLVLSPTGNIKYSGKKEAVNRWLPIIREHKAELLGELRAANDGAYKALSDPASEARRQKVLALLRDSPGITYAVVTDTQSDPDAVIVALAIRGRATCELLVPREKWDGLLLLDLIKRHGATVH